MLAKKKKPFSLKWSLLILVMLCWGVPVITLGGYCYFFYAKNVNEKIINSVSCEIEYAVSASAMNIDSVIKVARGTEYDSVIATSYRNYLRDSDAEALKMRAERYLKNRCGNDPLIALSAVAFDEPQDAVYCCAPRGEGYIQNFKEQKLQRILDKAKIDGEDIKFIKDGESVYIARRISDVQALGFSEKFATVIIELNYPKVFENLNAEETWAKNFAFTIDAAPVLRDSAARAAKYNNSSVKSVDEEKGFFRFNGSVKKDDFTFNYKTEVPVKEYMKEMYNYILLMVLLSIVLIPLLLFALVFFQKNFSEPLNQLVQAGRHLEQGDFDYRIEEHGVNSEFAYLIRTFNGMSAQLENLFEKVYVEEITARDAKIVALQSQINPHFLNNTLELMNWQARMAGDEAVSKMIEALSTLMDAALDRSGRRVITLAQELNCADAYLYIIHQRFGKRLTTGRRVDKRLLNFKVPPLIIQPLLENAVEHGIEPVTQGNIDMRIYKDSEYVHIDITNNGVKLTEEDIKKINELINGKGDKKIKSSTSLGIKNVNDRLKLIYGKNGNLSIFTDDFGNTLSKVVIPITQTEQ